MEKFAYITGPAVMYFVDDDNVYDLRVFEEARSVTRVGVWPVGLVGIYAISAPLIKNVGDAQVIGGNVSLSLSKSKSKKK